MKLTKEKTDKIIQQYSKQRDYAKIYYQQYQKENKDKINAYNVNNTTRIKNEFIAKETILPPKETRKGRRQ